jgi:glycosyltransferase involved in cell wall biosynthesis
MDFSVIIPTLNEEKYLPSLLSSIDKQLSKPKEIVVADANSKDKTREIAKKHGCKIVQGGRISVGRNAGAINSKFRLLVFMDADTRISNPSFFRKVLDYFQRKHLDIGVCFAKNEPGNKIFGRISITGSNLRKILDLASFKIFGIVIGGSGQLIITKRDVFDKLHGFDEKLVNYEDTDFLKRATKAGFKFGLIPYSFYLSGRRYDKMNTLQFLKTGYFMLKYKLTVALGRKNANKILDLFGNTKGPLGGD